MKNIFKMRYVTRYASLFGIALLLAAIVFGFTACKTEDNAPGGGDGSDHLTWTAAADSTFTGDTTGGPYIQDIAWGGNKFVAAGRSGQLASSGDGITWTSVSTTPFTTKHLQGICWGNGKFIAVGQDRSMGYSADGTTNWTLVEPANTGFTTGYINYIASNGSTFVAAGQDGLSKSADGTNWTAVSSLPGSPDFRTITYTGPAGSQKFIAVGGGGYIIHSSDGTTWTEGTYQPTGMENNARWRKIAWGAGKYVVVGGGRTSGSYIAHSTDLQNWTNVTTHPFDKSSGTGEIMDIVFADGAFFAVGTEGIMAKSKDGTSWTEVNHPLKQSGNCVISCISYGNNKFVIAERYSGKIAYSD